MKYYENLAETSTQEIKQIKQKLAYISAIRLIVFILICFCIYKYIHLEINLYGYLAIGLIAGFLALLKYHSKKENEIQFLSSKTMVLNRELNANNHQFEKEYGGFKFKNSNHPFTDDFDIFGSNSIFLHINRTFSPEGEQLLADKFINLDLNAESIRTNQELIVELKSAVDFRINFLSIANQIKDTFSNDTKIKTWLNETKTNNFQKYHFLIYLTPIFNVLLVAYCIYFQNYYPLILIVFQIIFSLFTKKITEEIYDKIVSSSSQLNSKIELFNLISTQNFHSNTLKTWQIESENAAIEIAKLKNIIDILRLKKNMLAYPFYVIIYGDLATLNKLEAWKNRNEHSMIQALNVINQFETYISIAAFAYINKDFTIPQISNNIALETQNLGHPLILKSKRIYNDFKISPPNRIFIVTGANMAGKSTFLRSVGVNLILASIGAPVCAEKFSFKPIPLYSCMRISDSIETESSYFFAELNRLQKILALAQKQEVFIFLDEPLKGTNSKDKLLGSRLYLENLLQNTQAVGLVATHDLELTHLAEEFPDKIRNVCFEINIQNDNMIFDYKIKSGITQNMNANYLMRKMGLI